MKSERCPMCGGRLISKSIGWKCEMCNVFLDMNGSLHEHIEKPFLPPMTNADRIRAMSDEELAEFLCSVYDDDDKLEKYIEGYVIPCWDEDRIKEWLQQPAED